MKAVAVGESAVLISCSDPVQVLGVAALVRERLPEVLDVVPAATTVLVDGVGDPAALVAAVAAWEAPRAADHAGREGDGAVLEVPVVYDGEDLEDVAAFWGVAIDEAIARHRDREYVVAFCGFAPGFAYCSGLPAELAVPRRDDPRPRVPAGSVAIADAWTGVYPRSSPGGWRLLGRTDADLWRLDRDPPALLVPGTRVRFVDA